MVGARFRNNHGVGEMNLLGRYRQYTNGRLCTKVNRCHKLEVWYGDHHDTDLQYTAVRRWLDQYSNIYFLSDAPKHLDRTFLLFGLGLACLRGPRQATTTTRFPLALDFLLSSSLLRGLAPPGPALHSGTHLFGTHSFT